MVVVTSVNSLAVPLKRADNTCMENEVTIETFQRAVDRLLKLDHGLDVYCWLRRRARAHSENVYERELEGSSDVTCHMFELFRQQCHSGRNPRRVLNDGFGFWINGEIIDHLGLPNVKATREYHNAERA